METWDLDGKLALVTGASRGIGRTIAEELSAHGARVALNYNSSKDQAARLKLRIKDSEIFKADMARREEVMVNIASNAGIGTAAHGTTYYAMSKAAVIMLTKRLAFELGSSGIRVNAIAPGWVESDMTLSGKSEETADKMRKNFSEKTSLGMTGKPEFMAKAAYFLCSDNSRYMNGPVMVVDGARMDNLTHPSNYNWDPSIRP